MKKRAFSLIELSIVILIIGILVAGVTQGSRLISQFRLQNARNLTQGSPVASVKDLAVWYEPSSEISFSESEQEDDKKITSWNDINPQTTFKINATNDATTGPEYVSSCINSVPCVRFNGTSNTLTLEENTFLNGSDYSIFVVERRSDASENMFLAGSGGAYANLHVGYRNSTTIRHAHYADTETNDATIPAFSSSSSVASIHTFLFSQTAVNANNRFYQLNGGGTTSDPTPATPAIDNSATSTDSGAITSWAGASIGSYPSSGTFYNGDIAEIIIFTRRVKTQEADEIREYLSKKYNITL